MSENMTKEITCETQGHLWSADRCIMCLTPKPVAEPRSSKELVSRIDDVLHRWGQKPLQFSRLTISAANMADLLGDVREHLVAQRTAHEPETAPHSGEHLQRFTDWLVKEMPAGTVIGDPQWWARKLLAAACVFADEAPAQPPKVGRTNEDYAIEHGRYLATAAEQFLSAVEKLDEAEIAKAEAVTSEEDDGAEIALRDASESRSDHWQALRSAIYEFRKRADRATATKSAVPTRQMTQPDAAGYSTFYDDPPKGDAP